MLHLFRGMWHYIGKLIRQQFVVFRTPQNKQLFASARAGGGCDGSIIVFSFIAVICILLVIFSVLPLLVLPAATRMRGRLFRRAATGDAIAATLPGECLSHACRAHDTLHSRDHNDQSVDHGQKKRYVGTRKIFHVRCLPASNSFTHHASPLTLQLS